MSTTSWGDCYDGAHDAARSPRGAGGCQSEEGTGDGADRGGIGVVGAASRTGGGSGSARRTFTPGRGGRTRRWCRRRGPARLSPLGTTAQSAPRNLTVRAPRIATLDRNLSIADEDNFIRA